MIMFPIVPQNFEKIHPFSSPELISRFVTGSSKLLVPGKVTASEPIPRGATSDAIAPSTLVGLPDIMQLSVGQSLTLERQSRDIWREEIHWVRALRIADDCHSYNVLLKLQDPGDNLVLQATKPIEAGHELLLWFSEDVLALLQIVFLTPANIQGQKKYVCTKCSALYESPNPLKLHIGLACGRYSICSLWERLSRLVAEHPASKAPGFSFQLSPDSNVNRQRTAIDLSVPPHSRLEPSAFKPFKKHPSYAPDLTPMIWPSEQFPFNCPTKIEDVAHIESLVSSLGKSKRGHVCLYCGKCYSRKYGLKIHIRTHTGYKPLKCKYCLRPFGDPSNLNKHVRLHAEGNTPYKCELCGKILVRRRDLERHLKSRHLVEVKPTDLAHEGAVDDDSKSDSESRDS